MLRPILGPATITPAIITPAIITRTYLRPLNCGRRKLSCIRWAEFVGMSAGHCPAAECAVEVRLGLPVQSAHRASPCRPVILLRRRGDDEVAIRKRHPWFATLKALHLWCGLVLHSLLHDGCGNA